MPTSPEDAMREEKIKADLLPCPFCGGSAAIGRRKEYRFVNCTDCLASTDILAGEDMKYTAEEAAEHWNTRAGQASVGGREGVKMWAVKLSDNTYEMDSDGAPILYTIKPIVDEDSTVVPVIVTERE